MTELNVSKNSQLPSGQLYFVQWLRVLLISLVVAHHAGQPYGSGGEWPVSDPASNEFLGAFFMLNASFFMGFFFLLAGYFVEVSYDRKGPGAFIRSRLLRLGTPLVLVSIFVFGLIAYSDSKTSMGYFEFLLFEYIGHWQIEMGPLWFIAQLLVYCFLYALWRNLSVKRGETKPVTYPLPGHQTIFLYAMALGIVGGGVRIIYPPNDWVHILWLIPAELAHLPQYISMFIIGIIASRGRWIEEFDLALGRRWFLVGVTAFILALVINAKSHMLPEFIKLQVIQGGLESFICVGFILGLLAIGRTHFSKPGIWWGRLDGCVYGVYIFHVFNVVGVQMAILDLDYSALTKFAIVTVTSLIVTFVTVAMLRCIPFMRKII